MLLQLIKTNAPCFGQQLHTLHPRLMLVHKHLTLPILPDQVHRCRNHHHEELGALANQFRIGSRQLMLQRSVHFTEQRNRCRMVKNKSNWFRKLKVQRGNHVQRFVHLDLHSQNVRIRLALLQRQMSQRNRTVLQQFLET